MRASPLLFPQGLGAVVETAGTPRRCSFKVSTYRNTPYGFDRSSLSDSQLKNLREYTCLIPYGGILNTSNDGNDAYMIRASFNANKMFNEVHSFSLTAGFEATSSKYKGYAREDWGYLPERGKKFVTLENLSDWPAAILAMQGLKTSVSDNTSNFISYYGQRKAPAGRRRQ